MEERYEIRGKIGQGGLGSVYRAYDKSLKREVALKRIATNDDAKHEDEAVRQMTQETGALAALQNPHIVTIYDVGSDDDGPFVVMELLKGETLDEIVEKAPLTYEDFREFVLQVQEGLIAAQDLGLVHRDLKPSNIMLNWLPSGKFQVKIVDFGLAKFSASPSLQTVDHSDSVFGSIFFMAPEQFERVPLDARADMYAMGCVYYFALTGETPFQGDTGPQVMAAHLEHRVRPLADVRQDIPAWVCDWVMWHMNRQPEDRPEHAREALQNFIQMSNQPPEAQAPPESTPDPAPTRPRLLVPGASPTAPVASEVPDSTGPVAPAATQSRPQPLKPPDGSPPSVHTTTHQTGTAATAEAAPDAPPPAPSTGPGRPQMVTSATPTEPAAASAAPTQGGEPSAAAGAGGPTTVPLASATAPGGTPTAPQVGLPKPARKKGLSNGAKVALASVLAIVALILGLVVMQRMGSNKEIERYNEIVGQAAYGRTEPILISGEDLELLLRNTRAGGARDREATYNALALAEAEDGTDVDARIAEFATQATLPESIRVDLLGRVLEYRESEAVVPTLLDFVARTDSAKEAAAALAAIEPVAGDELLGDLLGLIRSSDSSEVRRAAEDAAADLIQRSDRRDSHAETLSTAERSATDERFRRILIRLLGVAGGERAGEVVAEALENDNPSDTLAAIEALKSWPDDGMFQRLMQFVDEQTEADLRRRSFDAAFGFITNPVNDHDPLSLQDYWERLARSATLEREKLAIINGVTRSHTEEWAVKLINQVASDGSERVKERAERALEYIAEQRKLKEQQ